MADLSLTDVLIVGAGPVGLTLANVLARHGIAFRIIDRVPTYQVEIRAKGLTPRTEEIFEDLGILDQIHERGQRNLPMRFYNYAYRFYGVSNDALVLVRPDGYVGLTGGKADQEPIIGYLRNVVGYGSI